jgi:L-fucose isomerase-like protein
MELALSLALVFGARHWVEKASPSVKRALLLLLLAIAGEQVVSHRKFAKSVLYPRDVTRTVEYRAAVWADQNLRGERVFLPGSIAQWANAFSEVQQFSGGNFSMATNQVQQNAYAAIVFGGGTPQEDARLSLTWLKAFGVGAVGISAANSKEFWKPFTHPAKFDGVLPVLWREEGVTIYRLARQGRRPGALSPQRRPRSHVASSGV